LVLVDVSGSMDSPFANKVEGRNFRSGTAKYPKLWEAAALFGAALAVRAEKADLVAFETSSYPIDFRHGGSILKTTERFGHVSHGGTNTWQAYNSHIKDHDRVVILTDEQAHPGYATHVDKPLYIFNLAGYRTAMVSSDKAYTFGGLTDTGFAAIEMLEAYKEDKWPWER